MKKIKGITYPHTDRGYIVPDGVDEIRHVQAQELKALENKIVNRAEVASKKSAETRGKKSTDWKILFLKFRSQYLKEKKSLYYVISDSTIINAFRKKYSDSPRKTTLYSYIQK